MLTSPIGTPPRSIQLITIVSLILGIVFRVVNLDYKVYWYDETFTSLRISGYLSREVRSQLAAQQPMTAATLYKYQRVNPDRNVYHTLTTIVLDDPHHGPLYYILVRLWAGSVGDTIFRLRLLSALTSLLAFPCLYWLCMELFRSRVVAWTGVALLSLSSFHIIYAQEAREYALWAVLTILCSACLLYAKRTETWLAWGLYSLTTVLAWYSHTLFGLVFLAHAVFVVLDWRLTPASRRLIWRPALGPYLSAATVCLILYLPWVWVTVMGRQIIESGLSWTTGGRNILFLASRWGHGLTTVFLDPLGLMEWLGLANDSLQPANTRISWPLVALAGAVVGLVVYAGYYLWRAAPRRSALFILTLAGLPFIGLATPDIILGGIRSTVTRYQTAGIIAVALAVAFLIGHHIAQRVRPRVWQFIFILLLGGSVLANYGIAGADLWWNKGGSYHIPPTVQALKQTQTNVVVASSQPGMLADLYSISYYVPPDYLIYLVFDPDLLVLPAGLPEFAVYKPTNALRHKLTALGFSLTLSPGQSLVWLARQ